MNEQCIEIVIGTEGLGGPATGFKIPEKEFLTNDDLLQKHLWAGIELLREELSE